MYVCTRESFCCWAVTLPALQGAGKSPRRRSLLLCCRPDSFTLARPAWRRRRTPEYPSPPARALQISVCSSVCLALSLSALIECSPAESPRVSPVATGICLFSLATGLGSQTDLACLGLLQLLALSSVQLSCSLHIAFAAVPRAPAISFVASAVAICLCVVTAWQVWPSGLAVADFCSSE